MSNARIVYQLIAFFLFVTIQVLFFRNIVLFGNTFCFAYIGFLLLIPIETGVLLMLLLGFVTGLSVDIVYDSLGIHASACVFLMFLRNYWINLLTPQGGYDTGALPSISLSGWRWYTTYSLPLILIHHMVLFYVEAAGFTLFGFTLMKVILSTIFTYVVLLLIQYLFYNKKRG